ncbi:hypothetical protein Mapa_009441 [Marchantia paleacea]|nr:hypothetical protein Mapa_009441 [Marchantia paleacea]
MSEQEEGPGVGEGRCELQLPLLSFLVCPFFHFLFLSLAEDGKAWRPGGTGCLLPAAGEARSARSFCCLWGLLKGKEGEGVMMV